MLRILVCEPDNSFTEVHDPAIISDILEDRRRHLWLDIEAPTEADFAMIAEEFNLHPLAIEDAHRQHQRPKIEQYDGFYFVVFYSVEITEPGDRTPPPGRRGWESADFFRHEMDHPGHEPVAGEAAFPGPAGSRRAGDGARQRDGRSAASLASLALRRVDELAAELDERVILRELAMFMGSNYLVTVHADPIPELAEAERRWRTNARILEEAIARDSGGAAADRFANPAPGRAQSRRGGNGGAAGQPGTDDIGILLYSVIDTIVDDYFPVIDSIVERVEKIEEQIFEHFSDRAMHSIFSLKKDLLALRRVLAPERDVLNVLTRRDLPLFSTSTLVYFQDIYDHIVRITDSLDTYRDLLSSALDSYLSMQSNRLNVTVKTLTSASIILMTLSLIAGIYGMNFANMPELQWRYGYFAVLGLMAAVAVALFLLFKSRGWF